MVSEIVAPFQVSFNHRLHPFPAENSHLPHGPLGERIQQQRLQHAAKPIVCWNIEPLFSPPQNGLGQLVFHQFSEQELQLRPPNFIAFRQRGGKLHEAVIEKRRPKLE
jgi:hypothetical protein